MKQTKDDFQALAKELMIEIKELYPKLKSMTLNYEGSGDNFDDFYGWKLEFEGAAPNHDKQSEIEGFIQNRMDIVIWEVLDDVGADFNNDGCRGTIYFNFENIALGADLYEKIQTEEYAGKTAFIGELEESDE